MVPAVRARPPSETPPHNTLTATSTKYSSSRKGALKGPMKNVGINRRRPQRKDRHSKIFTARGPRDRRMRLSLDVARKFFDLQDMLGFDKASKTVDWLLTNATSSIKELASCSSPVPLAAGKSESSASECEVISTDAIRPVKGVQRGTTQSAPSKESRILARARARARTIEKIGQRKSLAEGRSSLELTEEGDGQLPSKNSGDSSHFVISDASDHIPGFDYDGNIVGEASGFVHENWSLHSTGKAEEQRVLFPDAQLMPWFWDPFSNPSI